MTDDYNYTPEQAPEHDEAQLAKIIARDNDAFRRMPVPTLGALMATQSVDALDEPSKRQLAALVRTFDKFTEENDPFGHHDFGSIVFGGETYFWKIDLYDRETKTVYTPDPTSVQATWRVLTIMHANDW